MSLCTWANALASLKFTLIIFVLFAAAVVSVYFTGISPAWILALPLMLFALNLTAAILNYPAFRRQTGLLVFHLALLSLVLLLAIGRLTYLNGSLEVTEGEMFSGRLTTFENGPLHPWRIREVRFLQKGYSIEYAAGLNRGRTRSSVLWQDNNGRSHHAVVGDHHPMILSGYRFYTSHNKGFAPVFVWRPADGSAPRQGSIHLPSYPAHEYKQAQSWTIPGTQHQVWSLLEFDEVILDREHASHFRVPKEHHLVMRHHDERSLLRPGESLNFADGRLHYVGLRTWMGYKVFYDWTISWLLGACVVALLGLAWHYRRKWAAQPWLRQEDDDKG